MNLNKIMKVITPITDMLFLFQSFFTTQTQNNSVERTELLTYLNVCLQLPLMQKRGIILFAKK